MDHTQRIAELYDHSMRDWPGEIRFYQDLISEIKGVDKSVLEIACGTGRVALQLAKPDVKLVGFDICKDLLDIAHRKSIGIANIELICADMRSFQLNRQFPLIISPGHSFQVMITIEDQLCSLKAIARHLTTDGKLVIHVNHDSLEWLAQKFHEGKDPNPSKSMIIHPKTGNTINRSVYWRYKPAEQTAFATNYWVESDETGSDIDEWSSGPNAFHVFFPFEMNLLFKAAGYKVIQIYGDFHKNPLVDNSPEMIWIAELNRSKL